MLARLGVALAATMLALPAAPAAAGTDVFQFVAAGSISPGIPTSGCASQSVSFSSTLMVDEGDHTGTYDFGFIGNSNACSQSEQGSGTLSGDITGSITYERIGFDLSLWGTIRYGGDTETPLTARCAWQPTSLNPVQSFSITCVGNAIDGSGDPGPGAPLAMIANGTTDAIPASGCASGTDLEFAGTATYLSVPGGVSFSGESWGCASLIADSGSGSFSGIVQGWANYQRDAVGMVFTGAHFTLRCAFLPASANPTTTFALACAGSPI